MAKSPASQGQPRILETAVPARFPERGQIVALICGEAPGPRGADKSSWQFWGDQAGKLLFQGLHRAGYFSNVRAGNRPPGLFDEPTAEGILPVGPDFDACEVLKPWDGTRFAELGIEPILEGVALTNAYDRCPTGDGERFHRPTETQLKSRENLERLRHEVESAAGRAPQGLQLIAVGTAAASTYRKYLAMDANAGVTLHALPHPAPQGILSWQRALKVRGIEMDVKMLRQAWMDLLVEALKGRYTAPFIEDPRLLRSHSDGPSDDTVQA